MLGFLAGNGTLPKTTEGGANLESQWTPDERMVVVQDQRLKSIIILPGRWLTFSQGLRNANHIQTLDLADIYGTFVYEDNLIQRSHFAKDCFSKTPGPSYKSPVNNSSVSKGFQPKFAPKLIQSSSNSNNQVDPKFQKDYKAEYKKMKAKLALLEASPSKVSDEEEVTQVKVLMALADDELTVGKSHARNGEWVDITIRKVNTLLSMDEDADWQNYLKYINIDLKFVEEQRLNLLSKYNKMVFELNKCRDELLILKQAKLDAVTFQIQNTKLTKLNHALQEQLKEEKKINEKWLTSSKKVSQCISEQIPHQKKKVLGGELLTESLSKININENAFIPASMGYDQEMVPKTKDWVEKLNPDSKLPNFNTGRILVPESQVVNESLETLNTPESSKDSEAEFLTPLPPLKNLRGASPSSEILKATEKPFPPCTHYGFNDHRPDDCTNYPECEICGSYDHSTSGHNRIIQIKGGVLVESSQSNESPIGLKCNTCGRSIHSTTDHNEFDHFKRGEKIQDAKAMKHTKKNDVYVLDMSSLTLNGAYFFAKASESVNWLWHKRLSHLNFKNINKLAKQNKVLGLLSLVYSKDKPYTTCEKGKHHRASSFKTKQNFSIRKCLHLFHMDLFGPVSPMSINHEKYTLVIVDEYSRYTWVHFLRKKSQAPKVIMSFIRMVENQNDVKVKQIRTDNETEFRNHELESFCDEKRISQNFSSPYTPEQNGVAERKNITLIEAA
ncbi:retrovirus-related pol polyprotein from transposon TNT 1-94 [Tanacetum coccineum]